MTKTQKRHSRSEVRHEKKAATQRSFAVSTAKIKEFSKKVLHDYVIPMTRSIEHRLLRLEQSL